MSWPSITSSIHARVLGVFRHPEAAGSSALGFTYEPGSGPPVDFDGVWRSAHLEVSLDGAEDPLSSEDPVLDARLSDLPATLAHGVDVVVKKDTGDRFLLIDTQKDGEGLVRLVLNREAA